MKHNFLIIGNWKMNPKSLAEALKIYKETLKILGPSIASKNKYIESAFCVPNVFLPELVKNKKKNLNIGIQDAYFESSGAMTGIVSIEMISSYKPSYAIVGHSEVRARGETNSDVNQKTLEYLRKKIKPIICVGEHERDQYGAYLNMIREQIESAVMGVSKKDVAQICIAYEPIWAVGKDALREATPTECLEVSIHIRRVLTDLFGVDLAKKVKILYGGSVNTNDAMNFIEHAMVDGLLIGRTSIVPKDFSKIVKDVYNYAKNK